MSWLNLNQSLNSLKGQITNFASEVLSEAPGQDEEDNASNPGPVASELEDRCHKQELEIATLKKLNEELQASLRSEQLSRQNGVKDEDPGWYWDPPPEPTPNDNTEEYYKSQIQALQDELSTLKERDSVDARPDTEEEVHRLREENKQLTNNLEDLDQQHQQAMDRLLTLKKELQKNFEILKQEHEDIKTSNDEYSDEIKTLLAKIKEKDKTIEGMKPLKEDYETVQHKYQNLERIYGLLRENAEKFQEENQDLHEEVFKLQEQVTKLEHDLEISVKNVEFSDTVPKEKFKELEKELKDLKDRNGRSEVHLDEVNIDDNAKSVIENLKREIKDLRHKLAEKEIPGDANESVVKHDKILQLFNKYVNFEIPLDIVGNIPSNNDDLTTYKLESVFKTVNSFKKEIDNLEHLLSEKNHNINHLQTQIDDLTTENDFLTADLQHFESELNEMKKNNEFLLSELTALKNVSKLEPIIETHEDNLAKLENDLADSNQLNKTFESEIKRIEAELAEVRNEKTALQDSLMDLKTKYTTMLSEVEMCKNKTTEVEELETQANLEHESKLKNLTQEVEDLKKKNIAANSKNEQLSIDFHIVENDKVLLTKQIDELKTSLAEKVTAHNETEALKLALEHKLHIVEHKLEEATKSKVQLESERTKLEDRVVNLEQKLDRQSDNSSKIIEKHNTEKKQLIENLEKHIKDNEKHVKDNTKLKEGYKFYRAKVDYLEEKERNQNSDNSTVNKITLVTKNTTNIQTIDELEMIKAQQGEGDVNKALLVVNEENKKLKFELSSTDSKILHLEREFEKLLSDVEEKDMTIEELNTAVHDNKIIIFNLNRTVTDLEQSITSKDAELERLRLRGEALSNQLVNSRERFNQSQEELFIVRTNAEDIGNELNAMREQMALQNSQIDALAECLRDVEKARDEHQIHMADKDRELEELKRTAIQLNESYNFSTKYPIEVFNEMNKEKNILQKELDVLKKNMSEKNKELEISKSKASDLEKLLIEYKSIIDKSTTEKSELINLINLKHNESLQYHNEIQRLNQVILEQTNEFQRIVEEKDKAKHQTANCTSCDNLRVTLKEKDEIIKSLNQNTIEYDRLKTELGNASEAIKKMTEKCNSLDKNLAIQLEVNKELTAQNAQLSDQEQNLTRELERLRRHLVETEESYTQELMTSEAKLTECQTRLHQVEERAKQTSTVYTSNSIRANQEVETLRNQIKLLEKQREEVQAKLSEADDARSRSEAALTNLQIVLEQFQLEKNRDVTTATEKIRNKMEDLRRENIAYQDEISRLNTKLEEALAGLQAASRLGDQLETKTAQINDLKEQVKALQSSVAAAEERYHNAISNQQDKVDKNLVKNLVINYVISAAGNNKIQVLRILSTVLDFNQQECSRLGLSKNSGSDSLAAEFVKFLHDESTPRPKGESVSRKSSVASSTGPPPPPTATATPPQTEHTHKRNPSTGSNNLLFTNIDKMETSSQISQNSRTSLDTGVNQTRNNEAALLKHVLRDM